MTNLERVRQQLTQSNADMARQRAVVEAAIVPESDLAGGDEPVTVGGWYATLTISGREAWRYCHWHSGRLYSDPATYDLAASAELTRIADLNYWVQRDWDREQAREQAERQ